MFFQAKEQKGVASIDISKSANENDGRECVLEDDRNPGRLETAAQHHLLPLPHSGPGERQTGVEHERRVHPAHLQQIREQGKSVKS